MDDPFIRPASINDVRSISRRLRDADRREILAAAMRDPEAVLWDGIRAPDGYSYAWEIDRAPQALFGAVPLDENSAAIWMVGTDYLETRKRFLLRHVRPVIEHFHKRWPLLVNTADARNTLHHRFIKWAGFTFFAERRLNGLRFLDFARINPHV